MRRRTPTVERTPTGASGPLDLYRRKRDFRRTPEPGSEGPGAGQARQPTGPPSGGARGRAEGPEPGDSAALRWVIQKHDATRLHYDLRLELDGVLLSWAVPKGPSLDPSVRRLAVQVEDHPLEYADFEGVIPAGQYGAGRVIVWDRGHWVPVGDPHKGLADGKLVFQLHGEKLAGAWELIRTSGPGAARPQWLLFKKRDAWARPQADYDVVRALPDRIDLRETRPASGARKAELPKRMRPQLATLAASVPPGRWLVEAKYDGYRILARIERGQVELHTRSGQDWTAKLGPLADALARLPLRSAWLDGEIVVQDADGVPVFGLLQDALADADPSAIRYLVFDLPYLDGEGLRGLPLQSRRERLQRALAGAADERVGLSAIFDSPPAQMLAAACAMGLEGIMLKRPDAKYVPERTDTWLKLRCSLRQEFVVLGFANRSGSRTEVGSLLLGYHDDEGRLRAAGRVGTGWDAKTSRELHAQLWKLETRSSPIADAGAHGARGARRPPGGALRWVKPELVAEVRFSGWTPDGNVRHAVFLGLRTDKPVASIVRERVSGGDDAVDAGSVDEVAATRVTNPDRVVDAGSGLRKLDLVRYYEAIADWILPHMRQRPVALLRAPDGIDGEQFFQRHTDRALTGIATLDPELWPGHAPLMVIDDAATLALAAQLNAIEFHTWNATARSIGKPDRIVFDLDPGEGVDWPKVREAALLMRALLSELGLDAWLKTSGGKGLHLVVPIAPKLGVDVVKAFSKAVVEHMARTIPERFVAKSGPANRVGRIYIDYLRNGHGQTTVCAFSARARPGLPVSMPIAWQVLDDLDGSARWTIATARDHLSLRGEDPWAGYFESKQTLARPMKRLGFEPPTEKARKMR